MAEGITQIEQPTLTKAEFAEMIARFTRTAERNDLYQNNYLYADAVTQLLDDVVTTDRARVFVEQLFTGTYKRFYGDEFPYLELNIERRHQVDNWGEVYVYVPNVPGRNTLEDALTFQFDRDGVCHVRQGNPAECEETGVTRGII